MDTTENQDDTRQFVDLRNPVKSGDKEYSRVYINRPTALELLDFKLPDLVAGNAKDIIRLVKMCGEFDDGTPLPANIETQLDMLDVIGFGGAVLYFLRGLDLVTATLTNSTSAKSSPKSSASATNTRRASSK